MKLAPGYEGALCSTHRPSSHHLSLSPLSLALDCDCAICSEEVSAAAPDCTVPVLYSLELTPLCNNRCASCANVFVTDPRTRQVATGERQGEGAPLDASGWEAVLETITPYAQRLALSGGEPTCHPEFETITAAVQRRAIPFTLFTNGRWQQPERLVALLAQCPTCAGCLISLHGADAAAHEAFNGVEGSFAETVENIERATRAGIVVHTSTVLTRSNAHQVEAVVALSRRLGAACAVFNRPIGTPAPEGLALKPPELARALREVDRASAWGSPTKIAACVPLCFVETSARGCLAGTAACTIDPWGYVRPCNHAPHVAGHILSQPLHTLWHAEALHAWRALTPIGCSACPFFARCQGGCRAEAVLHRSSGDPLMGTPPGSASEQPIIIPAANAR